VLRNVSLISGQDFVQWRSINCRKHMAYNVVCVVPTRNLKKVRYFLYSMLPDFRNGTAFRTVPRLRPYVLLKIRTGYLWNDNDRESPKHSAENLSQCHSAQHISHGMAWDRTRTLHGERPATDAWAIARPAAGRTRWEPNEGRPQHRTGWWEYFRP